MGAGLASHSQNDTCSPETWENPIPLGHSNLPTFPLEALPEEFCIFCRHCEEVANSYQVPIDLPAMLFLETGGVALAQKAVVHVRGDWNEPLNVYVVVVLEPGNRKSQVFRVMCEPLHQFEKVEADKWGPIIDQNRFDKDVLESKLKNLQKEIAKSKKSSECVDRRRQSKDLLNDIRLASAAC